MRILLSLWLVVRPRCALPRRELEELKRRLRPGAIEPARAPVARETVVAEGGAGGGSIAGMLEGAMAGAGGSATSELDAGAAQARDIVQSSLGGQGGDSADCARASSKAGPPSRARQ